MGNNSRNSNTKRVIPRDLNAVERVKQAFELRKQRLTYEQIAVRCGYANKGAAYNAIKRELERRIVPDVDDYREQELSILDTIHQKVWEVAFTDKNGDNGKDEELYEEDEEKNKKKYENKVNLWAVDRLLELSRDRRKLLNLDVQPEEIAKTHAVVREAPFGYFGPPKESGNEHSS